MNCQNVEKLLSAYIDNELVGNELNLVHKHVETCPKCQFEHAELIALRQHLSQLRPVQIPTGLEERLKRNFDKQPSGVHPWAVAGFVAASGVAAAFFAIAVAGQPEEPVQPIAQQSTPRWEIAADSAYSSGTDPISGVPVVTVGYARGQ